MQFLNKINGKLQYNENIIKQNLIIMSFKFFRQNNNTKIIPYQIILTWSHGNADHDSYERINFNKKGNFLNYLKFAHELKISQKDLYNRI